MSGKATFVAPRAGIACEIVFGKSPWPEHRGVPLLQRSDTVTGSVYRLVGGALAAVDSDNYNADDGDAAAAGELPSTSGAEDSDGGGDPFAAADAAADARRRRQRANGGDTAAAGPASASTPTSLPSRANGGGSLSLSSFVSALNLAGGAGGANNTSSSLAAAATTTATATGACGNDPSTHAGGATRGETLATCSGNWLSHLDWDGRRAWTLAEEVPAAWEPLHKEAAALPSDAGKRSDLRALAAAFDAVGDGGITADPAGVSAAQKAKEVLEVAQRADAKLRKEGRAK